MIEPFVLPAFIVGMTQIAKKAGLNGEWQLPLFAVVLGAVLNGLSYWAWPGGLWLSAVLDGAMTGLITTGIVGFVKDLKKR